MELLAELARRNAEATTPFLVGNRESVTFADVEQEGRRVARDLESIGPGEVVAIVGDFDASSIATTLTLLDRGAIVMPLTDGTAPEHDYFFDAGRAAWLIRGGRIEKREARTDSHSFALLQELRLRGHAGVIFFSSGTTGRPKAILHDFTNFLARYSERRPPLRTLNFLLFDHAGGINTLLHTLFNGGVVIVPSERTPESIARDIEVHNVELLPATPTFLRMMLLAGVFDSGAHASLRVITYGTERMDQATLDRLCDLLPAVDFRQTYGLSELGVFQVKSKARDSLWMKIGGSGIETRVVENVLQIRSSNRMLGYLNAPSPFVDGWYDTGDIVEQDDGYIRIVGRTNEIINVGGLKILPSEVERIALVFPGVLRAKAVGVPNPITGNHIEVVCEPANGATLDRRELMNHFRSHLQKQLCPHRITIGPVAVSHRFKQA
jgi:acyl-CoA synthetase (AMP-forming)/AMP-acid ligase II